MSELEKFDKNCPYSIFEFWDANVSLSMNHGDYECHTKLRGFQPGKFGHPGEPKYRSLCDCNNHGNCHYFKRESGQEDELEVSEAEQEEGKFSSRYISIFCGAEINAWQVMESCEHLEIKGYGVSDLEKFDSKGFQIGGIRYSFEATHKVPFKNGGLEEKMKKKNRRVVEGHPYDLSKHGGIKNKRKKNT
jgi:hypothetical protein